MRLSPALLAAALALTGCSRAPSTTGEAAYDVVFTGGTVIDGTGTPGYRADVAVRGDRIVAVSRTPLQPRAARVIRIDGHVIAPGFIDLHAHLEPIPTLRDAESSVRQGVTTALGGPDGGGPYPFGEYLANLENGGVSMNVGFLAGHNTIRRRVMGTAARAPTADELRQMEAMVRESMRDGAFGISTGLFYVPGNYSEINEVVALSRQAAAAGGIYTSHLRLEGLGLIDGVAEAIEIGRRANIPVVLTHHKAVGRAMWGQSVTTLRMIDSARAAGVDVMADQYPYTATQTGLAALIPQWAMADGDSAFARRTRDPVLRDSLHRGIVFNLENDRGGGDMRRVQFGRFRAEDWLEGKTLHDWVVQRELPVTLANGADLIIEGMLRGGASMVYHVLDEGDVERIMAHPQVMVASDGRLTRPGDGVPHPRSYGTFPRVLAHYVRDRGVIPLEEAVRKMTSMPADRIGLADRGRVAVGMAADLVVFHPATVKDEATFANPHQYPTGIPYVMVNGRLPVDGGQFHDLRSGRVLRHRQH
ncbi:MAG: amidohydrolase family protein [Gemmatimonadales bacterium]